MKRCTECKRSEGLQWMNTDSQLNLETIIHNYTRNGWFIDMEAIESKLNDSMPKTT